MILFQTDFSFRSYIFDELFLQGSFLLSILQFLDLLLANSFYKILNFRFMFDLFV